MKTDTKAALASLIADLRGGPRPDAVFTTSDLMQQTGHGENKCRSLIRQMIAAGKAKYSGLVPTTRIDGRSTSVPCYQLTGKK